MLHRTEFMNGVPAIERAKGNGDHPGISDTCKQGFKFIESGGHCPTIGREQGLIVKDANNLSCGAHTVQVPLAKGNTIFGETVTAGDR